MTSVASTDVPSAAGPPVVEGRFGPVKGLRRNAVEYAETTWRRHGDLVRMVVGPPGMDRDVWWVHHPDAAARVLSASSFRAYAKRDQVHEEIVTWLGPGLLTAEGEDWTRQKRFLQPVFTKAAVDGYADLMVEEIEAVVAEWDVTDHPTVDLGVQMQRLTLRVVLRALFGDAADDVLPHVRRSWPAVSDTIMRRGLGAVRLPAGIPTARVRRGRVARDDLFGVCEDIVADRRLGRTVGETDLLSRLIAARDGDARLSDEEVRSQVLLFMLAGHETTAIALTFALHLLGRHPDIQDRVRAEVREVLGEGLPSAATVTALPGTTAVLKEAMRLYPSAPILGRLCVADDELLGHRVPAGTNVVVVPWTIHRHPDVWQDPLVFDPGRFTGTGARPEPEHRYAWMPFGGGPRACIGQHFSMVEAVLALALVLRGHRVTALADSDHVPVSSLITLFPTEPVLARVDRVP
ncbi:MAG TPA: cytochrome P450 [Ornithinibacter sp.]|nr:cytochrome P450 [Ornithinibacter sp.]